MSKSTSESLALICHFDEIFRFALVSKLLKRLVIGLSG